VVRQNKNILPQWFIQAIQADPSRAPFEVITTSKENYNQITINHHSPTNISKNEISFYIPSEQSCTLASLDSYNEDESNRLEPIIICPYCPKFRSTLE
jgi:hypothetical protein